MNYLMDTLFLLFLETQLRDAATPKRLDKTISTISALAIHGRTVVVQGLPTWLNKADDPDAELYVFINVLFPLFLN